jgi:hypothetical protein
MLRISIQPMLFRNVSKVHFSPVSTRSCTYLLPMHPRWPSENGWVASGSSSDFNFELSQRSGLNDHGSWKFLGSMLDAQGAVETVICEEVLG